MNNLKKINGYYVDKKKIGQRIFNIRNSRNDTLEEFGKIFEAEKSNVLKWENGSSVPNRSRIEKIAKKGNITVNELLYGSVEEFVKNNFEEIVKKEFGIVHEFILENINAKTFIKYLPEIKETHKIDNNSLNDLDFLTEQIWDSINEIIISRTEKKEIKNLNNNNAYNPKFNEFYQKLHTFLNKDIPTIINKDILNNPEELIKLRDELDKVIENLLELENDIEKLS